MKEFYFFYVHLCYFLEASNPVAIFETSKGNIKVELGPDFSSKRKVENRQHMQKMVTIIIKFFIE